jgi:uncharacterized protein
MKNMSSPAYLLDVNIVVALLDPDHMHYRTVRKWLTGADQCWGTCAFTEAGFLRIATDPRAGAFTVAQAVESLQLLTLHPLFRFWPIGAGWTTLAAPFLNRVVGHKQITDAYLLGLAVSEKGILVTMDKGIRFLAGERYAKNVLVLE